MNWSSRSLRMVLSTSIASLDQLKTLGMLASCLFLFLKKKLFSLFYVLLYIFLLIGLINLGCFVWEGWIYTVTLWVQRNEYYLYILGWRILFDLIWWHISHIDFESSYKRYISPRKYFLYNNIVSNWLVELNFIF